MIQYWGYQEHVGALVARLEIKPFTSLFLQNRWCKWSKTLAKLDLEVHRGLHGRRAGIAQNAASTKALGPNSIRPWNQPTTFPSASNPATESIRSASSSNRCAETPCRDKNSVICSDVKLGPRKLPC